MLLERQGSAMGKGGSHLRRDPQPPRRSDSRASSRSDSQTPRRSQSHSSAPRRSDAVRTPPKTGSARSQTSPRRTEVPQQTAPRRSETRTPPRRPVDAPPRVAVTPPHSARPTPERRTPPSRKPPRRRRRGGGFPLWPVIVLLVAVIAVSLFMLGKTILGYTSNRADYNNIQNAAIIPRLPEQTALPDETTQPDKPVVRSEIPFDVDWDMLRQTNSDIIGWLYCPDTIINYPIVQTSDNDKYLTTNFSGKQNAGGAIFADYNSVIGIRASHLILYGHNMKDNSMFGTLKNYGDEAYFRAHPVFYLLTPNQAYRIDLLDCLTIDATLDNYPTYFSEGGSLESYVGRITSGAYWVNHEADYQNHQLVTMSTCTSSDDERLILQGVLVPIE